MLNHDSSRRLVAVTIVALALVSILASQAALAAVIANYPTGPIRGSYPDAQLDSDPPYFLV